MHLTHSYENATRASLVFVAVNRCHLEMLVGNTTVVITDLSAARLIFGLILGMLTHSVNNVIAGVRAALLIIVWAFSQELGVRLSNHWNQTKRRANTPSKN